MNLDEEKLLLNLIEKRKIFWEPIVAAAILLLAILGTMVPLYMHSDSANRAQIEAIRQDVKDFHMRLCEIQREKRS